LCIKLADEEGVAQFLYLNSDAHYEDCYAVDCARVPCISRSRTGLTAFGFGMIPRYDERRLQLFRAEKVGELSGDVAAELRPFAERVETLTRRDRATVLAALDCIINRDRS